MDDLKPSVPKAVQDVKEEGSKAQQKVIQDVQKETSKVEKTVVQGVQKEANQAEHKVLDELKDALPTEKSR